MASGFDGVERIHCGALQRQSGGQAARMPKPVVAAVHGQAYGAGFFLALVCDMVIAAEDTVFCQAFVKLGATPDSGSTYFLPRIVGRQIAAELIMLGEPLDAGEAYRLGLVNKVVPRERLDDHVRELAASGPAQAYARAKHLIAVSAQASLEQQLQEERRCLGESAATADFREGVEAFAAKRPTRFGAPEHAQGEDARFDLR
jgi:2-(1,2-epoxy-1,2-dihydrophenyl)acetyl-CoA isomerase